MILFVLVACNSSLVTYSYAAPLTDESTLNLPKENPQQPKEDGAGLYLSFIKLFAGLAVVVGVMLVTYYFAREKFGKGGTIAGKGKLINVVATQYIAPKKAIMVIEVAGEHMVVGVGEEINLLAKLGDVGQESEVRSQKKGFSEYLNTAATQESPTGIMESIKASVERLKGRK